MAVIKLNIPEQERDQVEIRPGLVFDVLRSDEVIVNKALDLQEQGKKLKPTDVRAIFNYIKNVKVFINELLGDGSVEKIAGVDNRDSIDFTYACALFQQIATPILLEKTKRVNKKIAEKYGDFEDAESKTSEKATEKTAEEV